MSSTPDIVEIPSEHAGPSGTKGTIAVDMDDVLSQTNVAIVDLHNAMFKMDPPIKIDDFENYLYWHNYGWGDHQRTVEMVQELTVAGLYERARPVPGAKAGLERLKAMGYRLIIITARAERQRAATEDWIAEHMPDLFDEIHFTDAFLHLLPPTHEEAEGHAARVTVVAKQKRSKAEIIHQTHALFLIDDSADNALACSLASPPVRVLLFGAYPWNAVIADPAAAHPDDALTYVERRDAGLDGAYRVRRAERVARAWLPAGVERVPDWDAVIAWVERFERETKS
ncbi:hypothetical protein Q5752_003535 [Cryptotrichosporon argae]